MNTDIFSQSCLFFISIFSNFISALSGGGAGLIQLPALLFFGLPFSKALATHKVASVALGIGASVPHIKRNNFKVNYTLLILISGIPGVLLGANMASISTSEFSTLLLGLLTLALSLYSLINNNFGNLSQSIKLTKSNLILGSSGLFIIGFLNGYLSSGTGLFVTVWMISVFKLSFTLSVAYTLVFVGIFWNGIGAFSLGLSGNIIWNYIPILILGSLIGGYLGAYFSIIKGSIFIKRIFQIVSFFVGLSLIIKALF